MSSVFTNQVSASKWAAFVAAMSALVGCSLPANLRDANVSAADAAPMDDVAPIDDVASMDDAPAIDTSMGDTGVPTDTATLPDADVVSDTGVVQPCTAATVPTMIAPISGAAYATSFVTFTAAAPLGSRVEFEYSTTPGFSMVSTTVVPAVVVNASGRASTTIPFAMGMMNKVAFVRARVICADTTRGLNPTPTRLFRVGTRGMAGNWTVPIVERYELDMDADAQTDVAIGVATGYVGVFRVRGASYSTLSPTMASASFGEQLAALGDVNGDGFGDLLVGDPRFTNITQVGRAAVYLGSNGDPRNVPAYTVEGNRVGSVGQTVAALGDLNDDGLADFAVSYVMGSDTQIAVYLSPHRSPLSAAQSLTVTGLTGATAMVAGDLTNDGRAELAIGFGDANDFVGAVFVFRATDAGTALPYMTSSVRLRTGSTVGRMGAALAMGAMIGDTALDLIVAAPGKASVPAAAGGILVYSNPYFSDTTSLLTSPFGASMPSSENFARAISIVGDTDADGASELLILHPGRTTGSNRSGVLLTEFYPMGVGFLLDVRPILLGTTTSVTFDRALSASASFLDSTNAGRQSLVLTVEQGASTRVLQSAPLSGGGTGNSGVWSASPLSNIGGGAPLNYTSAVAAH
ncbi:MAG: FG-GAP-like repeat-containing protein [Polyangiales bacterium]